MACDRACRSFVSRYANSFLEQDSAIALASSTHVAEPTTEHAGTPETKTEDL
jgi:hypothetical protein